ncbi:MAG: site-2 protease family protein [candidate division WOR-3 bacterium]
MVRLLRQYMVISVSELGPDRGIVRGVIREPVGQSITWIKESLGLVGYAALFRRVENGSSELEEHMIEFGPAAEVQSRAHNPALNIVLFLLTLFTTLLIGSLQQNGNPLLLRDLSENVYVQANYWRVLVQSLGSPNPLGLRDLLLGAPFALALLLILGSHELGHYWAARHYGVDASLPYFLPIPHPLMGTMGAFIRIRSVIPNRRALVRLGVMGPLVGFLFAVPILVVGLRLSRVVPLEIAHGGIALGSSLLFGLLSKLIFPGLPAGYDISLHPLAFAGWLGFFVTALNLIPIGQLDGGHIAYATVSRYQKPFQTAVLVAVTGLGFLWPGWFFWGILVTLLGLRHPRTQDEITPLERSDWLLVLAAITVFVLAFIPVPFPRQ